MGFGICSGAEALGTTGEAAQRVAPTGTAAQNSLSVLRVHPTEPDGSQGVVSPEEHPGRGEGIVRKGKGLSKDTNLQIQALLCLWEASKHPKIPTLGAAGSCIPAVP